MFELISIILATIVLLLYIWGRSNHQACTLLWLDNHRLKQELKEARTEYELYKMEIVNSLGNHNGME
jgi:hypothetical protein